MHHLLPNLPLPQVNQVTPCRYTMLKGETEGRKALEGCVESAVDVPPHRSPTYSDFDKVEKTTAH